MTGRVVECPIDEMNRPRGSKDAALRIPPAEPEVRRCSPAGAASWRPAIADGGHRGTGLVIPHRREPGLSELPGWKEEHNCLHRKVRARVERAFARMKG